MELIVRTQHGHISPATRTHIDERIATLERYFHPIHKVTVDIKSHVKEHRVQVTLAGDHGVLLRAEERAEELMQALDATVVVLRRQIERYKGKHWRHTQRTNHEAVAVSMSDSGAANIPSIVRTKAFDIKPMHDEEALEQMELLGHDFYVYRDHDNAVRVIYRRNDGKYGVIVTA